MNRAWNRDRAETGLIAAVIASGALLLIAGSRLTFLFDDWTFLFDRTGWSVDTFLDPHNEHIAIIPVAIYKLLLAIFGMESAFPFRVVSTALFLISAVLLFVYLRRRVDAWIALAGCVGVLFLGAAYEDLLWPFQMAFFGSMAAGLGMLLALERRDVRGDRIACALLTVSMAFSSLGLSFGAGALLEILTRADRWRRIYIVAIPGVLFALWWLGWGHTAENSISWDNLGRTPLFVANAAAAGLSSLLGMSTPTSLSTVRPNDVTPAALDWGRPLLVLFAAFAAWRINALGRLPRSFWVIVAIGLSFWILAGLNEKPGRTATAGRYQYVSAVFILLIAAELLRNIPLKRRGQVVLTVALIPIVVSNITFLHDGYRGYRVVSETERADLGALEIARSVVRPGFQVDQGLPFTLTSAQSYFDATDDLGTPAFTEEQLRATAESARVAADQVLGDALRLRLASREGLLPSTGPAPELVGPPSALLVRSPGCLKLRLSAAEAPLLVVPPAGVELRSIRTAQARIRLRRFAQQTIPVDLGQLEPGTVGLITIPPDRSDVPWRLSLQGSGPVLACGIG